MTKYIAEILGLAVEAVTVVSFCLSWLFGYTLSFIWGLMRAMQTLVLILALRDVPLPANATTFLAVFVEV